jgi:hypothetical protein
MTGNPPNPVKPIPLKDLHLDPAFQQRVNGLNMEVVREYMEILDKLPPPIVFFEADKETYWLPGGFHRYQAHKNLGREEMKCEIRKGDWLDAFAWSLGENVGQGREQGDIRKAILAAIEMNESALCGWTDGDIATMCRCSVDYVRRVKASLKPKIRAPLPPIRPAMDLVNGRIQTIPRAPTPNLDLAEEQGVMIATTMEIKPCEETLRTAKVDLARGLEAVTKHLAALKILHDHLSHLEAIVAQVWGKRASRKRRPTSIEQKGRQ